MSLRERAFYITVILSGARRAESKDLRFAGRGRILFERTPSRSVRFSLMDEVPATRRYERGVVVVRGEPQVLRLRRAKGARLRSG